LIREADSRNGLLRAEGYVYDDKGRRSHSVDEEGRITKYEYDKQSRLSVVLYPWTREKAEAERQLLNMADPTRGNAIAGSQMVWRESFTYDKNGQNRMVYSVVTSHVEKSHVVSYYAYDALGRRTLTESVTGQTIRTLYDGKGFEVIREGETFYNSNINRVKESSREASSDTFVFKGIVYKPVFHLFA
jgi:YD repeat-containing protein